MLPVELRGRPLGDLVVAIEVLETWASAQAASILAGLFLGRAAVLVLAIWPTILMGAAPRGVEPATIPDDVPTSRPWPRCRRLSDRRQRLRTAASGTHTWSRLVIRPRARWTCPTSPTSPGAIKSESETACGGPGGTPTSRVEELVGVSASTRWSSRTSLSAISGPTCSKSPTTPTTWWSSPWTIATRSPSRSRRRRGPWQGLPAHIASARVAATGARQRGSGMGRAFPCEGPGCRAVRGAGHHRRRLLPDGRSPVGGDRRRRTWSSSSWGPAGHRAPLRGPSQPAALVRKVVTPEREVLNQLTNRENEFIASGSISAMCTTTSCASPTSSIRIARCSSALEAYLSTVNNNLSENL